MGLARLNKININQIKLIFCVKYTKIDHVYDSNFKINRYL